jgi:hypothetical protein
MAEAFGRGEEEDEKSDRDGAADTDLLDAHTSQGWGSGVRD